VTWWWRVAVAVAATAVFGPHLLALPLWRDEVASVEAASRSVPEILAMLPVIDATHGTYYLLLHAVLGLGDPVVVARVFSLVCGVAAVVLVTETARRAAGLAAGTATAVLVIGNPFFAAYAREARPFALGAALVCAAAWVLLEPDQAALRSRRAVEAGPRTAHRLRSAGYVGLVVVAGYVHLFSLIPLVVLFVASRPRMRLAAVGLGVIAVALAPLVWLVSRQTVQVSWMTPLPSDAARTLATDLAGGTLAAWILYPLVVVLLVVRLRERTYRPATVLAAALAGPVVLLAVSYLVRPVYVERYVLASMPLLALAVGLLVGRSDRMQDRIARAGRGGRAGIARARCAQGVVAVAVVAVGLIGLPAAYAGPAAKSEDLAAAAAYIAAEERTGDCIAYTPSWARLGLAFYLRRDHVGPADVAVDPTPPVGLFAAERPLPEVTAALARCPRIWVAGYTGQAANWDPVAGTAGAALGALRSGFTASQPVSFGEFSVAMWTPDRVPVASP
jgi:mannosyltransferase